MPRQATGGLVALARARDPGARSAPPVLFTVPKRLRPYFLWRRSLLGDLARIAAATTTEVIRATIDGILRHIRDKGSDARAGPWAAAPLPGPMWLMSPGTDVGDVTAT